MRKPWLFPLLTVLSLGISSAIGYDVSDLLKHRSQQKFLAKQLLSRKIDPNLRPPGIEQIDDKTEISVCMSVNELGFCPKHQELSIGGEIVQTWVDKRLQVPGGLYTFNEGEEEFITLRYRDMFAQSNIWVPDSNVHNTKTSLLHKQQAETGGRSRLTVYNTGKVVGAFRFRTKIVCPAKLEATEVSCRFSFESFAQKSDALGYAWTEPEAEAVTISDSALLLLSNAGWELDSSEATRWEKFEWLHLNLNFTRIAE